MAKKEEKTEAKTEVVNQAPPQPVQTAQAVPAMPSKPIPVVKKGRKPWKVDLKWLFGILTTMLLTVSLLSFAVYRVASNPEVEKLSKSTSGGSDIFNKMLPKELQGKTKGTPGQSDFKINVKGKWYSPEQLNDMPESQIKNLFGKEIEEFMSPMGKSYGEQKQQAESGQAPSGIPGAPNMSTQDLSKMMGGADGANSGEIGQQMMSNMVAQAFMPAMGSALSGLKGPALTIFMLTILPALLFLILMIVFSYRWGHLLSFGVVLFLSAMPVFLVAALFKFFGSVSSAAGPKTPGSDPFSGAVSFVNILADSNFSLYLGLIIFSVILMGLAGLGGIITMVAKPKPAKIVSPPATPKPA